MAGDDQWKQVANDDYRKHEGSLQKVGLNTIDTIVGGRRIAFLGHVVRDDDPRTHDAMMKDIYGAGPWATLLEKDLADDGKTVEQFIEAELKKKAEREAQREAQRKKNEQAAAVRNDGQRLWALRELRGSEWIFEDGQIKVGDHLFDFTTGRDELSGRETYEVGGQTFVRSDSGLFHPLHPIEYPQALHAECTHSDSRGETANPNSDAISQPWDRA